MENQNLADDVGELIFLVDENAKIFRNCDGDCSCHSSDCSAAGG